MEQFIRNTLALILAWTASWLARLAVRFAGNGKVEIELMIESSNVDWDCVGGVVLLLVYLAIFWLVTM